jgi:succinate dehydrogenase/fumarate reductase flavoprotein subunit
MADLVIAGAGMAGLSAAAEARRLGATPLVFEKLDRAGGSMRLSSGVIWRHREFDRFRQECPDGDERLQRLIFERLDGDIDWLESLGARVLLRETGNPLTAGTRFDPKWLTDALVAAAGGMARNSSGGVELDDALADVPGSVPLVLATGGFAASRDLLRVNVSPEADHAFLRTAPGSIGDGLRIGLEAGAQTSGGMDQVYARAMPAPPARIAEEDLVRLSQLYAKHAIVTNEHGARCETSTWSENDVAQWQLRQPRARAWFTVPAGRLNEQVRERTVGEMIEAAEHAGARVTRGAAALPVGPDGGGGDAPPVRRGADDVTVETVAGVTTTLGGLAIDESARAAEGIYAAGADAGGIATGGYASGLAAALVFGRIAARAALGESP